MKDYFLLCTCTGFPLSFVLLFNHWFFDNQKDSMKTFEKRLRWSMVKYWAVRYDCVSLSLIKKKQNSINRLIRRSHSIIEIQYKKWFQLSSMRKQTYWMFSVYQLFAINEIEKKIMRFLKRDFEVSTCMTPHRVSF